MLEVQFLRGTTAQNDTYTGPSGSLTLDTELNEIRIHDGVTAGGAVVPGNSTIEDLQTQIDTLGISNIDGLTAALAAKVAVSEVGAANGVASLDGSGKVPAGQLPSFVDDVLEYADEASFPTTGSVGVIYVAKDTNEMYRWSGSAYINLSDAAGGLSTTDDLAEGATNLYFSDARARGAISVAGDLSYDGGTGVISFTESVASVAGKTGAVTLNSADVGLGNVPNQANATQPQAEAATSAAATMTPQATRWLLESMGFSDASGDWVLDQGTIS